ncbi:MAG: hypothetical protein PF447_07485 [Spirochaetaceae bacterium]|nr:hypothetical protein [Spirochaetaceae bacterium]
MSLPSVMIFSSIKAQMGLLQSIADTGEFETIKEQVVTMENLENLL